ncbi:hypothetical protein FA13DRAFT_1797510 [Coprinellus micaceus]|uniref:Uncharacterized protein n=1 Tax=Coprinellus micaceus TaxID=71717 RepID=A0A4Y7SQL2_COPMI|nr:hypothetical protein FA13DRAFT_1797510 [Coprinellus micaceus]
MSSDSHSSDGFDSTGSTEVVNTDVEDRVPPSPDEPKDVHDTAINETFDFTFAAPDNRILRSALPQWIGGNRVTRPQLIKDCAKGIKQARKTSTEAEPLSKLEVKHLKSACRSWFEGHTPPGLQKYAKGQGIRRWSLNQTIQVLLAKEVAEHRAQLHQVYLSSDLAVKHKANGRKVRTQWTSRHEEVRRKWTLSGPPVEVRQKNAVSSFTREASTFAWAVQHKMNAHVCMLVAYNDTNGEPVTFVADFSEIMGETSFYKAHKNLIDNSEVKQAWVQFMITRLENDREGGQDPAAGNDRVWRGVRALIILQRNNYGEPILLYPSTMPLDYTSQKHFLADMLRAMFTMLYGLAKGSTDEREIVPWTEIKRNPRAFIQPNYLSDCYIHLFDDPFNLTLNDLKTLANLLYEHQRTLRERKMDVPFFWFHGFLRRSD